MAYPHPKNCGNWNYEKAGNDLSELREKTGRTPEGDYFPDTVDEAVGLGGCEIAQEGFRVRQRLSNLTKFLKLMDSIFPFR